MARIARIIRTYRLLLEFDSEMEEADGRMVVDEMDVLVTPLWDAVAEGYVPDARHWEAELSIDWRSELVIPFPDPSL